MSCDGDFSGVIAIGKFVGGALLIFGMLWLFTQPVLLIIAIKYGDNIICAIDISDTHDKDDRVGVGYYKSTT